MVASNAKRVPWSAWVRFLSGSLWTSVLAQPRKAVTQAPGLARQLSADLIVPERFRLVLRTSAAKSSRDSTPKVVSSKDTTEQHKDLTGRRTLRNVTLHKFHDHALGNDSRPRAESKLDSAIDTTEDETVPEPNRNNWAMRKEMFRLGFWSRLRLIFQGLYINFGEALSVIVEMVRPSLQQIKCT